MEVEGVGQLTSVWLLPNPSSSIFHLLPSLCLSPFHFLPKVLLPTSIISGRFVILNTGGTSAVYFSRILAAVSYPSFPAAANSLSVTSEYHSLTCFTFPKEPQPQQLS